MPQTVGVSAVFDVRQFNQGLNSYVQGLQVATNVTVNTTKEVNNLGSAFSAGLGAAFGTAAINAVQGIASALVNLGSQAIQTVADFERLSFSIGTFIAQEYRNRTGVEDFSQALEESKGQAEAYQYALEQIAVKSPFTTQQVASIDRLALAYSFTTEQAYRLTTALVDFSSASGLSNDVLQRIVQSLGQMSVRGKITGEEIRELSRAGIPINDVLTKNLGLTAKQLEKVGEVGVPAGKVIEELVSRIEKDLGGSGERIAGTFTGLLSSLQDIKELSTRDFLTPVFEGFRPVLQSLVDTLTSPEFRGGLIALGELLGGVIADGIQRISAFVQAAVQAWQELDPAVKRNIIIFIAAGAAITVVAGTVAALITALGLLINPFTVLVVAIAAFVTALTAGFDNALRVTAQAIGGIVQFFADLVNDATGWGINIGESLADGIISGVNLIIEALGVLGQAIASLLAPGSPPKLLPDLDTWGTEAANVYLQGWTQADFGILNQMGNQIQRFLKGLAEQGAVNKVDVPSLVLGSRQAFAQAIADIKEFGAVTNATLTQIAQSAGPAADVVIDYAKKYGAVALATDQVKAAQAELNRVTSAYDALLNPLRDKLQSVTNASLDAQENQKIASLQRLIATRGVSDARKQAAQLEIQQILTQRQVRNLEQEQQAAEDVAQTQLTAAQQAQQDAQDELALFQARLDQQQSAIDLQNEQNALLEAQKNALDTAHASAKSLSSSIASALTPLQKQLKLVSLQKAELAAMVKEAKARAVLDDKNATAAEKAQAALDLQEISLQRQQRLLEVRQLGGSDEDLKKLQSIPITLEDITGKAKGIKDAINGEDGIFGGKAIDPAPLEELKQKIDEAKQRFEDIRLKIIETATTIDEKLPSFLKLFPKTEGGEPPILTTLQKMIPVVTTLGAIFISSKIVQSIQVLVGLLGIGGGAAAAGGAAGGTSLLGAALAALLTPIGLVSVAVAGLAAAWYYNLGGMRDFTDGFVKETSRQFDLVKQKFGEKGLVGLIVEGTGAGVKPETLQTQLSAVIGGVEATAEEQGRSVGQKIITGINAGVNADGPSVPQTVEQVAYLLAGVQPTAEEQAKLIGSAAGVAMVAGLGEGVSAGVVQSQSIGSQLAEYGKTLGNAIITGMVAGINENGPSVPQTAEQVSFLIAGVQPTAEEQGRILGTAVGDGFSAGVEQSESYGSKAMRGFMTFLFGEAAQQAEIKSPSKLFARGIGQPIGEGVAQGISEADTSGGIFTFIQNIIGAFSGLVTAVIANTGLLTIPLTLTFTTIGTNITTATSTMVTLVLEQYGFLSLGITTAVTMLVEWIIPQFAFVEAEVVRITTEMRTLTVEQYDLMRTEVTISVTGLSEDVIDLITALKDAVVKLFGDLHEGVVTEIDNMRRDVVEALGPNGLLKDVGDLDDDYKDTGKQLGKAMLQGLVQGLKDKDSLAQVIDAISGLAQRIEDKLKDALKIKSPSQVIADEIGAPIVEGIAAGMRAQIGSVLAAAQDIAAQTIGTLQTATAQVTAQPSSFVPGSTTNNVSNVRNYNLNVASQASSQGIINDFGIMEVLANT